MRAAYNEMANHKVSQTRIREISSEHNSIFMVHSRNHPFTFDISKLVNSNGPVFHPLDLKVTYE